MRIGLFAPLAGPFATAEYLTTLGSAAEQRGFHSVWVAEHVVLFDDYGSTYPYAENGRIPAPPESGMLEPFTALAFLAAVTKTLRLGTGHLPAAPAQSRLHRQGSRERRFPLGRAARPRHRRRLAGGGVPRGRTRPSSTAARAAGPTSR